MATGLELYEALKPAVGEEAAKMIAEALPMNDQVATKSDVVASEQRLMSYIDGRISASEARNLRWMLGFFKNTQASSMKKALKVVVMSLSVMTAFAR